MDHSLAVIQALSVLLALLVSALAWAAKLLWGRELAELHKKQLESKEADIKSVEKALDLLSKSKEAEIKTLERQVEEIGRSRDELIKVKDSQIAHYQNLISPQYMESVERMKEKVEKDNDSLKEELKKALRTVTMMNLAHYEATMENKQLSQALQEVQQRLQQAEIYSDSMSSSLVRLPDIYVDGEEAQSRYIYVPRSQEPGWMEKTLQAMEALRPMYDRLSQAYRESNNPDESAEQEEGEEE